MPDPFDALQDAEVFLDAQALVGPAATGVQMRGVVVGRGGRGHALVRVNGDIEATLMPTKIGDVGLGQEVFVSFEKPRGMFVSGILTAQTGGLAEDSLDPGAGLVTPAFEPGLALGIIDSFLPIYTSDGTFLGYVGVSPTHT